MGLVNISLRRIKVREDIGLRSCRAGAEKSRWRIKVERLCRMIKMDARRVSRRECQGEDCADKSR